MPEVDYRTVVVRNVKRSHRQLLKWVFYCHKIPRGQLDVHIVQFTIKSGSEHNKHVDGVVWGGQRSNSKYQQNMDSQTLVPQIDSWTSLWVETVWEESVFGYNEKSWALECLSKSRIRQEKMFPQIRWRLIHGDDCSLSNYTWMDIYT